MNRLPLVLAFCLLPLVAVAVALPLEQSFTLSDHGSVQIQTVSGRVIVTGWDRAGEVFVRAEIDGDHVEPEFEQRGDVLVIVEKHQPNTFQPSGSVHFEVFVPRETQVRLTTVSGDIIAEGLGAAVKASTVSGRLEVEVGRPVPVNLNTVSGLIRCQLPTGFDEQAKLKAVSGSVELVLAGPVNAALSARSINGELACGVALTDKKAARGHASNRLSGRFGHGAGQINLTTVSGNIRID